MRRTLARVLLALARRLYPASHVEPYIRGYRDGCDTAMRIARTQAADIARMPPTFRYGASIIPNPSTLSVRVTTLKEMLYGPHEPRHEAQSESRLDAHGPKVREASADEYAREGTRTEGRDARAPGRGAEAGQGDAADTPRGASGDAQGARREAEVRCPYHKLERPCGVHFDASPCPFCGH